MSDPVQVLRDGLPRVIVGSEGNWRKVPDPDAVAALAQVEELVRASRDLLANVPLPLEPTAEDSRRIIAFDVALIPFRDDRS